jgi:tRNA/tmRNA/rRNA uracil-C5-methylase (TrmA/RlmC/RlmD family)
LRHLVLRRGEFTGEILVLLSASSALQVPLALFAEELLALNLDGKIVGILHAQNDGVADAVKNENVQLLHGRDFYYEKLCGLKFCSEIHRANSGFISEQSLMFKVSMFSFFQTNSKAAEILYGVVRKFAGEGATALDMYCGTGTIAQIISPDFQSVVGVELIEEAVAAARENASQNNITNCEFHAGDAFAVLEALSPAHKDAIIVDPPRDGLHPKALAEIAALNASRLIYVACKLKSLVRDLPALLDAGYALQSIEAVDMFPRTPHVEVVALLQRENM